MHFTKTLRNYLVIIIGVAVFAMCGLPLMSTYLHGGESCTLMIRGYNLVEYSAWGIVPLAAPLLIIAIFLGVQRESFREIEILALLLGSLVSYVHGFNSARTWMYSIADSHVSFHPAFSLYPFAIVVFGVLSLVLNTHYAHSTDPVDDETEEDCEYEV